MNRDTNLAALAHEYGFPPDRLRVRVGLHERGRRGGRRYTLATLPTDLEEPVRHILHRLAEGDPTIARSYDAGSQTVYAWFKPHYEEHEVGKRPAYTSCGSEMRPAYERTRLWPA